MLVFFALLLATILGLYALLAVAFLIRVAPALIWDLLTTKRGRHHA